MLRGQLDNCSTRRGLKTGHTGRNSSLPARAAPTEPNVSASAKRPVPDARRKELAEKLRARRLEELKRMTARKPPKQYWSNRVLIMLATAVGGTTFILGTYHGYNAGKRHAYEEIALEKAEASTVSPPTTAPASATISVPSTSSVSATLSTSTASELFRGISSYASKLFNITSIQNESSPAKAGCELVELVQYDCELQKGCIVCHPVDRIFRRCYGRPLVEVTHIVEYDSEGNPFLPPHLA